MQHLYMLHSTRLCLGPCRTRSSWLQTCGHLYDTPDFERVMVWTDRVIWAGAWHLLQILGCQPDALNGAYCGDASWTRVESAYLLQAESSSLSRRISVSVVLLQHVLQDGSIIFVVPNASCCFKVLLWSIFVGNQVCCVHDGSLRCFLKYEVGIREVCVRWCRAAKLTAIFQRGPENSCSRNGVGPSRNVAPPERSSHLGSQRHRRWMNTFHPRLNVICIDCWFIPFLLNDLFLRHPLSLVRDVVSPVATACPIVFFCFSAHDVGNNRVGSSVIHIVFCSGMDIALTLFRCTLQEYANVSFSFRRIPGSCPEIDSPQQ